jgi:hypothetical protein
MPNRLEWENVQLRYKEALQSFLASKEKPAVDEDAAKAIPDVITISDDNDNEAAMEVSAENVDDDKNSVKKPVSDEEPVAVAEEGGDDAEPAEAAVVVNPDSCITDKALTDKQNRSFLSLITSNPGSSLLLPPSLVLLLGSFFFLDSLSLVFVMRYFYHLFFYIDAAKSHNFYRLLLIQSLNYFPLTLDTALILLTIGKCHHFDETK